MSLRGSKRSRWVGLVPAALALGALLGGTNIAFGGEVAVFADGFESGNTLAWTLSAGEPPLVSPEAYRMSDLDLRDPHVFVDLDILGGCFDFTDQNLPLDLAPSLNAQIEAAITTDGDSNGTLDLSSLLLFRPFSETAVDLRLDLGGGACVAPFPAATCDPDGGVPQTATYDALAGGTCLEAEAGTTSGYVPAVSSTPAPCFVSQPRSVLLSVGLLELPLRGYQLAGASLGDPPSGFAQGLLRGFLREVDADTILLPPELPIVGGEPLSILLRGGTGNCAPGDDRDLFEGDSGWWFYFAWTADVVLYTGP